MASTTAVNASFSSEEVRKLCECPVCTEIFRNPTSLPCGHSVCTQCCQSLVEQNFRHRLICPVCRRRSFIHLNNLPINFGLRDFVQMMYSDNNSAKCILCTSCKQKFSATDSWRCTDCQVISCNRCTIRFHPAHKLQEIKTLADEKQVHLFNFRKNCTSINIRLPKLEYRSKDFLLMRSKQSLKRRVNKLKQQLQNFNERLDNIDMSTLIMDDSSAEIVFRRLQNELSSLQSEQQLLSKMETEFLDVIKKSNEDVSRIYSVSAISNNEPDSSNISPTPSVLQSAADDQPPTVPVLVSTNEEPVALTDPLQTT